VYKVYFLQAADTETHYLTSHGSFIQIGFQNKMFAALFKNMHADKKRHYFL